MAYVYFSSWEQNKRVLGGKVVGKRGEKWGRRREGVVVRFETCGNCI